MMSVASLKPLNLTPMSFTNKFAQSLPTGACIPPSMANNRTDFIRGFTSFPDKPNNFDATNSILDDYNPTILLLYRNEPNGTKHTDLDETLLSLLTGSYHPDFTKGERDEGQYVSVFRSSNHYP